MSEQDDRSIGNGNDGWASWPFVRIFTQGGFRAAIQPGKIMLAVLGILALFIAGGILDIMTPYSARVVAMTGHNRGMTELDAYVTGLHLAEGDFRAYRNNLRSSNEQTLMQRLMEPPFNKAEVAAQRLVRQNDALGEVKQEYKNRFQEASDILARRYERRLQDIEGEYQDALRVRAEADEAWQRRQRDCQNLEAAYLGLFKVMIRERSDSPQINAWVNALIQRDPRAEGEDRETDNKNYTAERQTVLEAAKLADTCQLAQATAGQGIFRTFVHFKIQRAHQAVKALVFGGDLKTVKTQVYELLMGGCWLTRFHPFFALIMVLIWLVILALIGGAICRITALQFAREERIGPFQALKFSIQKFSSFFAAPLIPLVIILLLAFFLFVPSLLVAIPYLGELIGGLMFPLALFAGFIIALVAVGLIGGFNLMYPTIAVEGSDSFDAISRAFSYVFARPWRTGFYTLIAAVYGAICYLFVRFFAFLLLIGVHMSCRYAADFFGVAGSRLIDIRNKLDGLWPMPTFGNLQPDIAWMSLNGTEMIGGALIWIWVAVVVAAVLGFVLSYWFSAHTAIYFLLRQRVDATDLEDVFVEEDIEDLTSDEVSPPPTPTDEPPAEEPSAAPEKAEKAESESTDTKESEPEKSEGEEKSSEPEKPAENKKSGSKKNNKKKKKESD